MTINRISRLRDCGVFRDFAWPQNLPDFARYNLIYGWNGSGKTTLSRLFQALEAKTPLSVGQAVVRVNSRDLAHTDFGQMGVPVRVFNRDFVLDSVFPTSGDVAPIFIIGKQNVEKQKQVDQLRITRVNAQEAADSARGAKSRADSDLDKFCIDQARVIKDTLRSAGTNPYNNYNKGDFTHRAQTMIVDDDRKARALNDTARDKLLAQLRANPKAKISPLTYRLPSLKSLADAVSELLATTVVSAALQSLKDNAQLSSWVHTGLGLHQARGGDKCLFCDQPMAKKRLAALEAHFSTEYEDLQRKLDEQMGVIQAAIKTGADLVLPKVAELYDELSSEVDAASATLRGERDEAKRVLNALAKALEDKKTQAFEQVKLDVAMPTLNARVVDAFNQVLLKHNTICDEFQTRIDAARKQLEADSVASNFDEFIKLRDALKTADDAVTNAAKELKRLDDEIARLEREIVEHRQPAEELNTDLRNYLGHSELRLEIKANGYTIMRHDAPAVSLSEGETTAIALLYFLKSLQDRRFDLTKGTVILDDPVSSLDANALYSAFGFIRERTQTAAQLIILTHSFAFFRQVRNWFHHLYGSDKRSRRFYMLDHLHRDNVRYAEIRPLDPLLEVYESEYHYLFARIYRTVMRAPQPNLEQNYVLPNLARRLLEAFLAFRHPNLSGDLWQKMRLVQFDDAKKIRVIRFLHTHSHNDAFGEPEHDLSMMSEAHAVLGSV
ncbi:MAG: AAA family ATPase [Planctomycetes bacterium]|nr:AAA family ATPase [Planctomycetota bacterium]